MYIGVMVKAMALKLPSQTQNRSPVHLESPFCHRASGLCIRITNKVA